MVRFALDAAYQGIATDEIDKVLEAAEIRYFGRFIWWKEEGKLNAELARTILKQAQSDGSYNGPIQEDDEEVVKEAERYVKMARAAWEANVRGPDVETILKLADNGELASDEERFEAENPHGDAEIEASKLAEVEPWEDYDEDGVAEVCEVLDGWKRDDAEIEEVFRHVHAYETAHRGSKRILKRVDEFLEELKDDPKTEEKIMEAQPSEEAPQAQPTADSSSPEEDARGENNTEGGEGDGEEIEAPVHGESDARNDTEGEVREPGPQDGPREATPEADQEDIEEYVELVTNVETELEKSRIHIPQQIDLDNAAFDLPVDLTNLSDKELQYYHGLYTHLYYRCNYELAVEEAKARACKGAADSLFRYLIVNLPQYDEHGKQRTVTMVEAEAELDPNLLSWRGRQHKHESFASAQRNERDSYKQVIDSLSRLETMRNQEFERAGGA